MSNPPIRLDLGCGNAKREGFLGLDFVEGPQVDHVLDLTKDRFPFEDATVDEVFSAHFLEHIEEPNHVFQEIGRVCKDGARITIYTPYAFSEGAFFYGHLHLLTEEEWMHFCVHMRDPFVSLFNGRWLLHNVNYVVRPHTPAELAANGFSMDFALRYFKDVAFEFGVEVEFQREDVPLVMPTRTWSTERFGERHLLGVPAPEVAPDPPRVRRFLSRPTAGLRRLAKT